MGLLQWEVVNTMASLNEAALQQLQTLQENNSEFTCWIGEAGSTWIPSMDIRETEQVLTLTIRLPNVDPASIHLQVSEETVLLQGTCRPSPCTDSYYDLEFGQGQFHSLIPLPGLVHPQGAIAQFQENLLTLTLPRRWRERCFVSITLPTDAYPSPSLSSLTR